MRKIFTLVLALVILSTGFLIGLNVGYRSSHKDSKEFIKANHAQTASIALIAAYQIRHGKSEKALKDLDGWIYFFLNDLWATGNDTHEAEFAFSLAQGYYKTFNVPPPAKIKPVLDKITPLTPAEIEDIEDNDRSSLFDN